jgi:hypothetical protein
VESTPERSIKMKKCVSCHRNLDTPSRLDFTSDILNQQWCQMCVEFGMSLVDPDAAWALAGRGPVLEGARPPLEKKEKKIMTEKTSNAQNAQEEAEYLQGLLGAKWVVKSRVGGDGSILHGVEFRRGINVINVWLSHEAVVVTTSRDILDGLKFEGESIKIKEYILSFVDPNPVDRCAAAQKLLCLVQTRLAEVLDVVDASLGETYRPRSLVFSRKGV